MFLLSASASDNIMRHHNPALYPNEEFPKLYLNIFKPSTRPQDN